ncbi:MAG: lipopolysaccharide heptosyltransferase II [Candidatus Omnitrophota bacterium]
MEKERRTENIKKILVFGPNWIGDTIMSGPLIDSVKRYFKDSRVVMVTRPHLSPLWRSNRAVDEVWDFTAPGTYHLASYIRLFLRIRKEKFDAMIVLPHYFRYALLAFLAGIPCRAGYDVRWRGIFLSHILKYDASVRKEHMIRNYMHIAETLGAVVNFDAPVLAVEEEMLSGRDELFKKNNIGVNDIVIGLAPGAIYGPAKRWPGERYADLASALIKEYEAKVVIFAGPGEEDICQKIRERASSTSLFFCIDRPLPEAAALIKRCAVLITNDSGLMHIAGAVGTKIIAIFGSTSPRWTGPLGEGDTVIRDPVPCSPCFRRTCRFGTYRCLRSINVEEVMEAVRGKIKDRA